MRPHELTLRGFRSYADETTFSWEGRTLVGIVGPIGSGKSSILDAIALALYNKTPRVSRDTKSLINQRADTAHVSLSFEVDGETWRAVRALRRKGASQHTLYRVVDGEETMVTDRDREMTEEVERLLGLDFDAFRRSVLLAQNQFAHFLEATTVDKSKVLKGVFGFERLDGMRDVAKRWLEEARGRLAGLEGRRKTADQDRRELEEAKAAHQAAEARLGELEAVREPLKVLDDRIAAATRRREEAQAEVERLEALVDRIPGRDETAGIFEAAQQGKQAVDEAAQQVAEARDAREQSEQRRREVLDRFGGEGGLERAVDAVVEWRSRRDALKREEAALAEREEAVEKATAAQGAAAKAQEEAERARREAVVAEEDAERAEQAARDRLHAAHETDRVATVRTTLQEGEPCPVCEQIVATKPGDLEAADVEAAERALQHAVKALADARSRRGEADTALATRTSEAESAATRLAEAASERDAAAEAVEVATAAEQEAGAAVEGLLGEGDPEEMLAATKAMVQEAGTEAETAATAVEEKIKALEAARASLEESRAGVDRLRNEVANLAGTLEAEIDVGGDVPALEGALKTLRESWLGARTEADETRAAAAKELTEHSEARAALMEDSGLAAADDLVEVLSSARSEVTAAGTKIEVLEKRLAELESLAAEEKDVLARHDLLEHLHADLAPSRFLEYVLAERRRVLADLAGVHFEILSAGRYQFSEDGEFDVVDLSAADAVRSPASLSGGETFLASLALALALAEIVAREGGRLDAFFLDEGFGSLDPEHLDLAMDGVERLVSERADRLVVVVSHVPALTQRIEDLIVLGRDELTGDTRVLAGATAP